MKSCGKLLAVAAMLLWISQAIAQPPRAMRGPPGPGGGRGGGPHAPATAPSGGTRGTGVPGAGGRGSRFDSFFRSLDTNQNGMIEPDEVPEERKRVLSYMAQRAGISIDGPVSIEKLRDGMLGRNAQGPKKPGQELKKAGQGPRKSGNEPEPLVPGFGTDTELARVPGFGERIETPAGGSSAGRSSGSWARSPSSVGGKRSVPSKSGPELERERRIRGFAKSMMKRYDTDRSGVVEKHEWGQIKGDPKEIDLDHNGKITEDELLKRLLNFSKSRGGADRSESSKGGRSGRSRSGGSGNADRPRSYRFKTAMESLPEDLPAWFAELDGSGDGQVSMAEYSSNWDDRKANEFVRLDLNNDGLITPRECLEADSAPEPSAAPTGPSVSRPSASKTPAGRPPRPKPPMAPKTKPKTSGEKPWWET